MSELYKLSDAVQEAIYRHEAKREDTFVWRARLATLRGALRTVDAQIMDAELHLDGRVAK